MSVCVGRITAEIHQCLINIYRISKQRLFTVGQRSWVKVMFVVMSLILFRGSHVTIIHNALELALQQPQARSLLKWTSSHPSPAHPHTCSNLFINYESRAIGRRECFLVCHIITLMKCYISVTRNMGQRFTFVLKNLIRSKQIPNSIILSAACLFFLKWRHCENVQQTMLTISQQSVPRYVLFLSKGIEWIVIYQWILVVVFLCK